jgi:hypothetical protein
MADAAISVVTLLAKVAIRIMQLLQVQAENLKYGADMLKRVKNINSLLKMLSELPPDILADLNDMINDLKEVLDETEAFVSSSIADASGNKKGFFNKIRKARSVQNAEVVRDNLDKIDEKLGKHLQLLTAAQGAKTLQQNVKISEQIKSLEALSSQMFAFSMLANGMSGMKQNAGYSGPDSIPRSRSKRRRQAESSEEEEEDDDEDVDDEAGEEGTDEDHVVVGMNSGEAGAGALPTSTEKGGKPKKKRRAAKKRVINPEDAAAAEAMLEKLNDPIAQRIDDMIATKELPLAVDPESMRTAHYLEMAAHQFICASFVGGLAMMSNDAARRVVIIWLVPLAPIVTMMFFAWWAGQFRSMISATGTKNFLKMCWTVYRLYATPGIFGSIILAFDGRLHNPDATAMYSDYLWSCAAGIILFLAGYWLTEDKS